MTLKTKGPPSSFAVQRTRMVGERLRGEGGWPRADFNAAVDFRANRHRPPVAYPEAFLFRQSQTLDDALARYGADPCRFFGSGSPEAALSKARAEATKAIRRALGDPHSPDLRAGERELVEWVKSNAQDEPVDAALYTDVPARVCVAAELAVFILRVFSLFKNPARFFGNARQIYGPEFDVVRWPYKLGPLLYTWGAAALLNRDVHAAFCATGASSPERFALILAQMEGRGTYSSGGRPKGLGVAYASRRLRATLKANAEFVDGLRPADLAYDQTIYPEREPPSKKKPAFRGPSPAVAARKRTAVELGLSERTVERRLKRGSAPRRGAKKTRTV
ncbi:MAG TPA: hypothetical protein VGM13_08735 [Thermoanaerobaculia bacterium]